MSEALDEIDGLIAKKLQPSTSVLELSKRCFQLAFVETQVPVDPDDPLYGERWLYGQWVAAFEIMPSMSQAETEVHIKLMLHLCGISAVMKQTNIPFWHLFSEMAKHMRTEMEEIFTLTAQRTAILEKEKGNESMH